MIMGRGKAETLGPCCVLGEGLLMLQVWYFLFRSAGLDLLEPGCAAIEIDICTVVVHVQRAHRVRIRCRCSTRLCACGTN